MPDLDYPFDFVCADCGKEITVEQSDARDLALGPDSMGAVEIVLEQHGWLQDDIDGRLFCPDCTDVTA